MARHKTKTTSKTHTNRTTGARAATGSSAFPALSLTADTVGLQTGNTVAAKHPCWIDKGIEEFKVTVQCGDIALGRSRD